jgi:hypothetical protein
MSCVADGCSRSTESLDAQLVSIDGDFTCSQKCFDAYVKARDHFFNVTIQSEASTLQYLQGK